ncbi:hypothetical protein WJX84_006958, partial [Apatococcus fuscideae]
MLVFVFVLLYVAATSASPIEPGWFFSSLPSSIDGKTRVNAASKTHTVYQNLWYHNQRYLALLDSSSQDEQRPKLKPELSQNTGLVPFPVKDAKAFAKNLKAGWLPGNTLLLDFPFAAFPENIGHWQETLVPVYNVMSSRDWLQEVQGNSKHIDTVFMLNLRREQLKGLDWVWEMLRLVLEPGMPTKGQSPTLLFYDQTEGLSATSWLAIENAIVVNDRYIHPEGAAGFHTPELGQAFRKQAFLDQKLLAPSKAPMTITLLSAHGGEEVINRQELLGMLQEVGQKLGMRVRPYTVTPQAPFQSHLTAMARTGLLVSRHGPMMASSIFLPPGAAVLELLPFNWNWKDFSRIYLNATRSLGDIHHFAWLARSAKFVRYRSENESRYAHWTAAECSSRECLE